MPCTFVGLSALLHDIHSMFMIGICLSLRSIDILTDTDGDNCDDTLLLDSNLEAEVLARIQAAFASAGGDGTLEIVLSDDIAFVDDNVVRMRVSSTLPATTVVQLVASIIGVGTEFIDVVGQRRGRLLSSGDIRDFLVTVHMSGFVHQLRPDSDDDGLANIDDSCPFDPENDIDGDMICDSAFCFDDLFFDQLLCSDYRPNGRFAGDCESSGLCALCSCACSSECYGSQAVGDMCPNDADNDMDSDMICSSDDSCPFDSENDVDNDSLCGETTMCLEPEDAVTSFGTCEDYAPGSRYFGFCTSDAICSVCPCSCATECGNEVDRCPNDAENDADSDSLCGDSDSCPDDPSNDADSDTMCVPFDSCPGDALNDIDSDSICMDLDSCEYDRYNDGDGDSICGDVDSCPFDGSNDSDNDSICDDVDSCLGDALNDHDGDGLCSLEDPCPDDIVNACNMTGSSIVSDNGITLDEQSVMIVAVVCAVRI